jgi:hypothetical protein
MLKLCAASATKIPRNGGNPPPFFLFLLINKKPAHIAAATGLAWRRAGGGKLSIKIGGIFEKTGAGAGWKRGRFFSKTGIFFPKSDIFSICFLGGGFKY